MLASLFQFSFLCVVSLANLGLGFALASWLGWGPALSALFEVSDAATHDLSEGSADPTPEAALLKLPDSSPEADGQQSS